MSISRCAQKGRRPFMLETNLKIVSGGMTVRVPVRYARLVGAHLSSEISQRTCNLLGSRYQLAARPVPGSENQLSCCQTQESQVLVLKKRTRPSPLKIWDAKEPN